MKEKAQPWTTLKFYGENQKFVVGDEFESIISGPAETGKSVAALYKLHLIAYHNPGSQLAIVRKTRASMDGTVLKTYKRVAGADATAFGGEHPQWYDYANGSRVWVGGMDNPSKILSGERDAAYVNQAEELTQEDWEVLTTRVTGRGAVVKNTQIFGDCNPAGASHWILSRARQGTLKLYESRHKFNPVLYDQTTGLITAQGEKSIGTLSRLTGVRKARFLEGRWANTEGAVYEFDNLVHLIDRFPIPDSWQRLISIDFGFVNAFSCQWWTFDHDGRMYLYRYIYQTQRTVAEHADEMKRLMAGYTRSAWAALSDKFTKSEELEAHKTKLMHESSEWKALTDIVSDHDAEDRATLNRLGFRTVAASKSIKTGVENVQDRLALQRDGKPRLFILRDSLVAVDEELVSAARPISIEQEFDLYVWPKGVDGKPVKEEPVKKDDHALDALRYAVMQADRPRFNYGF